MHGAAAFDLGTTRPGSHPVLGWLVGGSLLLGGLGAFWVALATPFVTLLTPSVRGGTETILGVVAWSAALAAPLAFVMAGSARIVLTIRSIRNGRRPRPAPLRRAAALLDDGWTVVGPIRLPDASVLPAVAVGAFGLALVEDAEGARMGVPEDSAWPAGSPGATSIRGERPLERGARAAQALRRWCADSDLGFVVRVHAAVVSDDPQLIRTPGCAVIREDQVRAWLASLPGQRSLTLERRSRLVGLIAPGATSPARGKRSRGPGPFPGS